MALPDLHCYPKTFERPGESPPSRLTEWRNAAHFLVDEGLERGAKLFIAPGDLFCSPRPLAEEVLEVIELFAKIVGSGARVIACRGNHDHPGLLHLGPLDILASHDPDWGISVPRVLDGSDEGGSYDVVVTVLPWMKPVEYVGESSDARAALLDCVARFSKAARASAGADGKTVLVAHYPSEVSTYANGAGPEDSEPYFPLDLLAERFDLVVLGHVHRPQVLYEGKSLVLHPGTLVRAKLDEGKVPCGGYLVDLDDLSYEFIEAPARRVVVYEMSHEAVRGYATGAWVEELPDVGDAIVAVRYRATEEEARGVDHAEIMEVLGAAGAYHVEGIFPEIERSSRVRDSSISQAASPMDALRRWLSQVEAPEEIVSQALQHAEAIIADCV